MASSTAKPNSSTPATSARGGWWIVLVGWLFPGLGYFISRKWIRGALVLISVVVMFGLGLALQGHIYAFNTRNLLDMLGWVGDICNGVLYFFTELAGGGLGNAYTVMGNYGSMFLIAGGLLNLLAAADARDVMLGRKR